jgi:hypothetical protein
MANTGQRSYAEVAATPAVVHNSTVWKQQIHTDCVPILFKGTEESERVVNFLKRRLEWASPQNDRNPFTKDEGLACVATGFTTDFIWEDYRRECSRTWFTGIRPSQVRIPKRL